MGALEEICAGITGLLGQWEASDALSCDGAKAIAHWVLTHKRLDEARQEAGQIITQIHGIDPNLSDLMYRVLGLPLD
jgi:hypothetical protein